MIFCKLRYGRVLLFLIDLLQLHDFCYMFYIYSLYRVSPSIRPGVYSENRDFLNKKVDQIYAHPQYKLMGDKSK